MHSHFGISWDYDTVKIKGRKTPVIKKGGHVISISQKGLLPYSYLESTLGGFLLAY